MGIFELNSITIDKYRPYLKNVLGKCGSRNINIYNEPAGDGNLFMYVVDNDTTIRINSMYSPVNEAQIWAKNSTDNYDLLNITVMFGFGNGYCVREILNRLNRTGRMIVFEPDAGIFNNVIRNYDVSDVLQDDRILVLVGEDNWTLFKEYVIENVRVDNINYAHVVYHPAYNHN